MGSRANTDAARERRIKRLAMRVGIQVMKPLKPEPRVRERGGYMLRDEKTMKILLGESGYKFSATMEEVEAYFDNSGVEEDEE